VAKQTAGTEERSQGEELAVNILTMGSTAAWYGMNRNYRGNRTWHFAANHLDYYTKCLYSRLISMQYLIHNPEISRVPAFGSYSYCLYHGNIIQLDIIPVRFHISHLAHVVIVADKHLTV
jgi:hypothetical protein